MESLLAIKPPAAVTLRHRLRTETAAVHESLHQNAGLKKLTNDNCSVADYAEVLALFFNYYRELEERFHLIPNDQRFIYEAKPLRWLEDDFSVLNQAIPQRSFSTWIGIAGSELPLCTETYIGYLYVKQGSTLGGQTISKHLKKSLALEPGVTQFFFNGFGEHTGYYWKEFLNYLSLYEADLDADLVINSAQTYFGILDQMSNRFFPGEYK